MGRTKPEKPQRGNPHELPCEQHVFPAASIARFADASGRVCLHDLVRDMERPARRDDSLFLAKRAWDYRAEAGYMKTIEDAFQELASRIIDGAVSHIGDAEKAIVDDFCALWNARATHRELPQQEIQAKGIIDGGSGLTPDQEEMLEKNGYCFMRAGGRQPARQLNGIAIHLWIRRIVDSLSTAQWGIIRALEGQFIVPDFSDRAFVPLTPTLCLMSPSLDGVINERNVAEINSFNKTASRDYFFARDFSKCPFGKA